MLCKLHFKKLLPFPPIPFSFLTECFSNSSHQPHPCSSLNRLRDPDTVHLFCSNALKVSAKKAFLPEGKQIHSHLIKFGFCHVLSLQNQILSVDLKCKETKDAEKLFEELPGRNVVSWNIMIRGIVGYDNENDSNPQLCFSYFNRMLMEMVVPDYIGTLRSGTATAKLLQVGFGLDSFVGCALVDLYAKCGLVENAKSIYLDHECSQRCRLWYKSKVASRCFLRL